MIAAREQMGSGRGFGSLSLREVARGAGIVLTGFYCHFKGMGALGLALVAEVGETLLTTLRQARRNEFELGGIIDALVRIFLEAVEQNRAQFLFLAREQFGGSQPVRQALTELRENIAADVAKDLALMSCLGRLDGGALGTIADLFVQTVFATLSEVVDPPASLLPIHRHPTETLIEQLRFILIGAKNWCGSGVVAAQ